MPEIYPREAHTSPRLNEDLFAVSTVRTAALATTLTCATHGARGQQCTERRCTVWGVCTAVGLGLTRFALFMILPSFFWLYFAGGSVGFGGSYG